MIVKLFFLIITLVAALLLGVVSLKGIQGKYLASDFRNIACVLLACFLAAAAIYTFVWH